jgi:hypothetical protein
MNNVARSVGSALFLIGEADPELLGIVALSLRVSLTASVHAGMTGTYDYRIRADMVYFTTPNNGATFSTGSIAFGQALPCENFASNASKVLKKVVDASSKNERLPHLAWIAEEKQWRWQPLFFARES